MTTPCPFSRNLSDRLTNLTRTIAFLTFLAMLGTASGQLTPEFLAEVSSLDRTNTPAREGIGSAVGISGDWIVAGAPDDDTAALDGGAAYFYRRSGGVWSEETVLTTSDAAEAAQLGFSAALSGHTAVVGAYARDSYRGGAYVFVHDGSWTEQQRLEAVDGLAYDQFGFSVAIDGDLAVLGAPQSLAGAGAVYLFRRDVGAAWHAWNILDVSSTGGTLHYSQAVAPENLADAATNGWRLQAVTRLVDDFGAGPSMHLAFDTGTARFGVALDFDDQGGLLAYLSGAAPASFLLTTNRVDAAAYHTHELVFNPTDGMAAYLYDGLPVHAWAGTAGANPEVLWGLSSNSGRGSMNYHQVRLEIPAGAAPVALYDAGILGATPAATDPVTQGWTRVGGPSPSAFEFPISPDPTTYWKQVQKLTSSIPYTPNRGDYGCAVAIQGETIVVGGQYIIHPDAGTGGGAVFVYEKAGELWTEVDSFTSADNQNLDSFGVSVDLDGDYIAVGATGEDGDDGGGDEGAAYVFKRNGNAWEQQEKLVPANHVGRDSFGNAIRLAGRGSLVAVGSRADDPLDLNSGSVFFFSRLGADWIERLQLLPSAGRYQENFGTSIDLDQNTVVVGCRGFYSAGAGENYGDRALVFETDYSDATAVITQANSLLYYPSGLPSGYFDRDLAAFRYRQFLYGMENNEFRAQFETFDSLYGDIERARSREAENLMRAVLGVNPSAAGAQDLLLDIYYDRAVAETIVAKNLRTEADHNRLNLPVGTGYVIDAEIPLYEEAVQAGRDALTGYLGLLADDLGVGGDPPLGYLVFQQRVPARGLAPAQGTNAAGNVVLVVPDSMLFNGYKDLVLMFDLLREHGRSVVTLCRLKAGRDRADDATEAMQLSEDAQRFLFLQGSLLLDLFPGLDPQPGDPSGLAEAIDGWSGVLHELNQMQPLLAGRENPLGFEDDFLMLVEPSVNNPDLPFDSFNALARELDPGINANSPLGIARDRLIQARQNDDLYRGYQSQLQQQLEDVTAEVEDRLFAMVGARPGQPGYDSPGSIPGSEIWQQTNSIEVARIRILHNRAEMDNLNQEVEIELQRAGAVSNALIDYGAMQARLSLEIGNIHAAQAGAEAFAETFSLEKLDPVSIGANSINGGVQIGGELLKAQAEAEKEQTAAMEQAVLAGLDSTAAVKTKLLGMKTLALDSQEAAVLMKQEIGRLTALLREKADLEATLAEAQANLASRYFADPIHRMRAQHSALRANLAFERARQWLFLMGRALAYKWNTPFELSAAQSADGRDWTVQSLFKLRNAEELMDMYQAMLDYDSLFELFGPTRSTFYDWFSVREDFLGYRREGPGEPELLYPDPDGSPTPVNAITAFQRRLKQIRGNSNLIRLVFSTVRQNPGGTFFRGPKYLEDIQGNFIRDQSGNRILIDRGLWLDKIDWMKIRLPGQYPTEDIKTARLTYGGTSFIRNERLGLVVDPERPDRIVNELTPYTTRYWFYSPSTGSAVQNAQSKSVTIQYLKSASSRLEGNPQDVLPILNQVLQINAFRERAVAASQWVLEIQTSESGITLLNLDNVHDIEFGFVHHAAERPEF